MASNEGQILFGVWKKQYRQHYGKDYVGNVYRDANMLKRVAGEIGQPELFDLIRYYFESTSRPDFTYFIFNYDKVMQERDLAVQDRERRKKVRDKTRQRMIELGIPVGFSDDFDGEGSFQNLVCKDCGLEWNRLRQAGRPPVKCDECKGKR